MPRSPLVRATLAFLGIALVIGAGVLVRRTATDTMDHRMMAAMVNMMTEFAPMTRLPATRQVGAVLVAADQQLRALPPLASRPTIALKAASMGSRGVMLEARGTNIFGDARVCVTRVRFPNHDSEGIACQNAGTLPLVTTQSLIDSIKAVGSP
jgi:hypothetical protein